MKSNSRYFLISVCLLLTSYLPEAAQAGGISLGATRAVYLSDKQQISLSVSNSDEQSPNLIQSWVSDKDNKKSSAFIVTPPLFVINPKRENTLRIIHTGAALPQNQETLFWINVKAIPAIDPTQTQNKLQLAVVTRIKLFYRPSNLKTKPEDALALLRFQRQGAQIYIDNPSPYYLTLINFKLGDHALPNIMVAPHNRTSLPSPDKKSDHVAFQSINDYGAITSASQATLQ
ncbi:fimbria/pilus periplasmic chaperone [Pseudomonas chlororaphis]|uniref:fimbria/pilus periplasmic chaperone n=1 Tax=Pseudomonas chlororaphis TaxID=587753 RepID=UPI0039E1D560